MKDKLRNKVQKVLHWIRKDKLRIISAIVWIYLLVRYQGIRDLILGILKFISSIWAIMAVLVVVMVIYALVTFALMLIGVKLGVLPKDYLKVKLDKARKKREEKEQ